MDPPAAVARGPHDRRTARLWASSGAPSSVNSTTMGSRTISPFRASCPRNTVDVLVVGNLPGRATEAERVSSRRRQGKIAVHERRNGQLRHERTQLDWTPMNSASAGMGIAVAPVSGARSVTWVFPFLPPDHELPVTWGDRDERQGGDTARAPERGDEG